MLSTKSLILIGFKIIDQTWYDKLLNKIRFYGNQAITQLLTIDIYDHRVDSPAVAFYFYQDTMAQHISSYRTNTSFLFQFSSVGT